MLNAIAVSYHYIASYSDGLDEAVSEAKKAFELARDTNLEKQNVHQLHLALDHCIFAEEILKD